MNEHELHLLLPARRADAGEVVALAERAERLGWAGVWSPEVLSLDAIAILAAIAARTDRLLLGTAIVPISTRSAALLAMAAATLGQLAPGRFELGIGVSTPAIVEARHDRPVRRPLEEASGVLRVVRSALRGERVEYPGTPAVSGLSVEPADPVPPVLLAALGPRMTELAHAEADGLLLNLTTLEDAKRRAQRRPNPSFRTALLVRTSVDPDDEDIDSLRREVAAYTAVPAYRSQFDALGLEPDEALARHRGGDATAIDPLVEATCLLGTADHCRAELAALAGAGVTPVVQLSGSPEARERTMSLLSPLA